MRFNPPPNWPPAPEGWEPPQGWRPPPSWPAPPAGWRLWVQDRNQEHTEVIPTYVGTDRAWSDVAPRQTGHNDQGYYRDDFGRDQGRFEYSPGQYETRPPAAHRTSSKTNNLAVTALVLVLVLGVFAAPFTGAMADKAKKQIAETGEGGGGIAQAAYILSVVYIALIPVFIIWLTVTLA